MKIRINKILTDVAFTCCATMPCFAPGRDQGVFVQGRGYTSYHKDAKGKHVAHAVCATRHYHGCPDNSICPECRLVSPMAPGTQCEGFGPNRCGATRVPTASEER